MTNATKTKTPRTIISWETKKQDDGSFDGTVTAIVDRTTPNEIGHYCDTYRIKTINKRTRAQAKGAAIKWVRYFKANANATKAAIKEAKS